MGRGLKHRWVVGRGGGGGKGDGVAGQLTVLPVAYFFSVATMVPALWAWFNAPLPRTTVSRCEDPPPVLLPIFVTVSQSSDMVSSLAEFEMGDEAGIIYGL